jgi:taurine dioxygenase
MSTDSLAPSPPLRVEPVAGALGAEVSGLDLGRPLDDGAFAKLHDAWMEHQVLFFRDQPISREQHKAFGRRFGTLHVHPVLQPLRDAGHPEIVVLESGGERGGYVAARWHSDVTFEPEPPLGSILRAVEVPAAGGDTLWASMYAAWEALSDRMQRLLSGLEAVHDPGLFRAVRDEAVRRSLPERVVHPVVRTHPVTGRRALFVNSVFTRSIEGMRPAESRALLGFLFEHLGQPEFTCRLRWRRDTVAMWDNRCTQHRVVADNLIEARRMERVTIRGDRPFFAATP